MRFSRSANVVVFANMPETYRRRAKTIKCNAKSCVHVRGYALTHTLAAATSGLQPQHNALHTHTLLSFFHFACVCAFGSLSSHALACNIQWPALTEAQLGAKREAARYVWLKVSPSNIACRRCFKITHFFPILYCISIISTCACTWKKGSRPKAKSGNKRDNIVGDTWNY